MYNFHAYLYKVIIYVQFSTFGSGSFVTSLVIKLLALAVTFCLNKCFVQKCQQFHANISADQTVYRIGIHRMGK